MGNLGNMGSMVEVAPSPLWKAKNVKEFRDYCKPHWIICHDETIFLTENNKILIILRMGRSGLSY